MAPQLVATALIHWLDPDKGGRKALPSGSIYAATGRFAEREDELFRGSSVKRDKTKVWREG